MTTDGRCYAGQMSVNILSRAKQTIEPALKSTLLGRLSQLCVEPADMEDVPQTGEYHGTGEYRGQVNTADQ